MADFGTFGDIHVTLDDDHVATAEIRRPPNNFFSLGLIESMAEAFRAVDDDPAARAIVLCSEGKHFCAGADFANRADDENSKQLYAAGVRLFRAGLPVVAAVAGYMFETGLKCCTVYQCRHEQVARIVIKGGGRVPVRLNHSRRPNLP